MAKRRRERQNLTPMGLYLLPFIDQNFDGSMEDAAKAAGISVGTLNSWLRGGIKDPRVETLKRVAAGLGASYDAMCRIVVGLEVVEPVAPPPKTEHEKRVDAVIEELRAVAVGMAIEDFERMGMDIVQRAAPSTEAKRKGMQPLRPPIERIAGI